MKRSFWFIGATAAIAFGTISSTACKVETSDGGSGGSGAMDMGGGGTGNTGGTTGSGGDTSTGGTGTGGGGTCISCNEYITGCMGTGCPDAETVCGYGDPPESGSSFEKLMALGACSCAACETECADAISCGGETEDSDECAACMQGAALGADCTNEMTACAGDT